MEMRRRFMKEKLLTPPNICTMLRIVGTVGLYWSGRWHCLFIFLVHSAVITDVLDGTIARATNSTSEFGARLDSIADLIFYAVMIVKFSRFCWKCFRCGCGIVSVRYWWSVPAPMLQPLCGITGLRHCIRFWTRRQVFVSSVCRICLCRILHWGIVKLHAWSQGWLRQKNFWSIFCRKNMNQAENLYGKDRKRRELLQE